MAVTVIVRSGDMRAPPSITFDAPRVVIGRGDGCEIRLPDPSISHRHASIRQRGTDYVLLDEGSTNGTYFGATRLETAVPRVLHSGDLVRVGRVWLEIRIEQALATVNAAEATKELALALVAEALAAQGDEVAARIRVSDGPDAGRELAVTEFDRRYVVGRGNKVDLTLDDEDASRRHAEVFRKGDHLWVRDLGSKNGTAIGDLRLEAEVETTWPRGEVLVVGANRLTYEDPVLEALEELECTADERVAPSESIDPPVGAAPPEHAEEAAPIAPAGPARSSTHKRDAPIKKKPLASRSRRGASRHGGWTPTDYLVALLAIVVLGLSLMAMWWLFRS